jgi:hypothetical protein
MAKTAALNSFELNCNDAFFALIVESLRAHMLRTRRVQTLRRLIEFCLVERLWELVRLEPADVERAIRLVSPGEIKLYLSLPSNSTVLLRAAKADLSVYMGAPLSSFETIACLLRMSLEIPGAEWAA